MRDPEAAHMFPFDAPEQRTFNDTKMALKLFCIIEKDRVVLSRELRALPDIASADCSPE